MNISESCAKCLYDKQKNITDDPVYLAEVLHVIRTRKESDTAPLLVYRFNQIYQRMFGETKRYAEIKKRYNDLLIRSGSRSRQFIKAFCPHVKKPVLFCCWRITVGRSCLTSSFWSSLRSGFQSFRFL